MLTVLGASGVKLANILLVSIPATLIGVIVGILFVWKRGKELSEDPEFQERMKDPAVLKERAKVELIGDEGLDRQLPKRISIVEITLNDGTHFTERIDAVPGTAENPMPRDEVIAKCRDLIAPQLGSATCNKLIEQIWKIENLKNIRELRPLLQKV